MKTCKGVAVSPGIVTGPTVVLDSEEFPIRRRNIAPDEVGREIGRLRDALALALEELQEQQQRVRNEIGDKLAAIFDLHSELLSGGNVEDELKQLIKDNLYSAEYATSCVFRGYAKKFLEMPYHYMAERVADIYDVEKRLLRHLIGERREHLSDLAENTIIIAHDLSPSQTANLDRERVLGFATDLGGRTSHTAIVARAMGIPGVVGLKTITVDITPGDTVIIDGNRGQVIINPDEPTLRQYAEYEREFHRFEADLGSLRDLPAVTTDGHRVTLVGNIEFPQEVEQCLERGAEGIGLYRTEFLYLDRAEDPTEEDHYEAYAAAIEALGGRPITIRTCDLGADKFTHLGGGYDERNPFLGLRSIRFSLQHVHLFKTQLRAILRASTLGPVQILFPLISNIMELRQAKMMLNDVREEFDEDGLPFDRDMKVGTMIEVPSAAIMARQFARECDFFSIGTNDLIQYTLAVDRSNERVATLFTPSHPAVLYLVKRAVDAANAEGIGVTICGEMAGEPQYTILLLGLGIGEFSIAPTTLPEVKKLIRSVSMADARKVADRVFELESEREISIYLVELARQILPKTF